MLTQVDGKTPSLVLEPPAMPTLDVVQVFTPVQTKKNGGVRLKATSILAQLTPPTQNSYLILDPGLCAQVLLS
jgi:hypothetical protein